MKLKLSKSSLPTTTLKSSSLYTNHITLLVQNCSWFWWLWRCLSIYYNGSGETLSYISRLYGVLVDEIAAANKDIVGDADQLFEGQRLRLDIPSTVVRYAQLFLFGENNEHRKPKATAHLRFDIRQWNQILTVASSSLLTFFLLLLVAFGISDAYEALYKVRVAQNLRHQDRSNSKR